LHLAQQQQGRTALHKHRDKAETMIEELQEASRDSFLKRPSKQKKPITPSRAAGAALAGKFISILKKIFGERFTMWSKILLKLGVLCSGGIL